MVEVTFFEDSRQRLSSFVAQGHAGWADSGDDVVCAAISALLQGAWLGLAAQAGIEVTAERADGRLELSWPVSERERSDVNAIVETAALAVRQIAEQYPSHVRFARQRGDGR
jgi:uncharacterized protein YsxB (DUF464 family)